MIKRNTVLVLGAGASAPFGFPLGQGLKDQICERTLVETIPINVMTSLSFTKEDINRFKAALINSGRSSVDAFLEHRDDFLDIGKTAIATALLPYETTSSLFSYWAAKRMRREPIQADNWYDLLFDALTADVPFNEFDRNKLSIITFNYDRSIEHYLFTSLKNSYNKTDEECEEQLRKIEIIHVHGSLGPLDWQSRPAGLPSVSYDSGAHPIAVKLAAQNITIIHESVADTPEFTQARNILRNSTQVFFLGFGYHPANLKRLGIGTIKIPHFNIRGTSYGLSYEREINIGQLIPILQGAQEKLVPKDVYTFLHEHVRFGGPASLFRGC